MESKAKGTRGKVRIPPGYHVYRGWFYKPIQNVIDKWDPIFGREFTRQTFQDLRRTMENGYGNLNIYIKNSQHRRFVCELMCALEDLHDRENASGWAVKLWGQMKQQSNGQLISYNEMAREIEQRGGPKFEPGTLRKAAERLYLNQPAEKQAELERSVYSVI